MSAPGASSTGTHRIEARQLLPGRGPPVTGGTVLVVDGRIAFAGPSRDAPDSPGAEVTRCDTVLPGLWDAHVHLFGLPDLALRASITDRIESQVLRAARDAGAALRMGVTAVRDLGGLGVHVEAVRGEGLVRAPRVYSANAALTVTGGHGDVHDLPMELVERNMATSGIYAVCDGVPEVVAAVRRQLRLGATVIKVCATGGVLSEAGELSHRQFRDGELRAAVEEAAMADRVVAAHCHGAAGIEAAIAAGVHTIEHGTHLDAELATAMVERDMVLVPTATILDALLGDVGRDEGTSPRMRAKAEESGRRHAHALATAIDAGVRSAVGTDLMLSVPGHAAGWGRHARELELLVAAGMSELEAIEAATATGPTTLGPQAPDAGMLVEGWEADVLALSADPVADITVLQDPASITGVWQAGERVVTSRDGVPHLAPLPLLGD